MSQRFLYRFAGRWTAKMRRNFGSGALDYCCVKRLLISDKGLISNVSGSNSLGTALR